MALRKMENVDETEHALEEEETLHEYNGMNEDRMLTLLFTADVDIRVRVRGGGHTSQVYAIRQAIAKSIVCPTEPPQVGTRPPHPIG